MKATHIYILKISSVTGPSTASVITSKHCCSWHVLALFILLWWGETMSLWNCSLYSKPVTVRGILYGWIYISGRKMIDRRQPKYSEYSPTSATLCNTNPTYTAWEANPRFSSEKQTINHGTARCDFIFVRQRDTKSNLISNSLLVLVAGRQVSHHLPSSTAPADPCNTSGPSQQHASKVRFLVQIHHRL
jgi:hypothetical protein